MTTESMTLNDLFAKFWDEYPDDRMQLLQDWFLVPFQAIVERQDASVSGDTLDTWTWACAWYLHTIGAPRSVDALFGPRVVQGLEAARDHFEHPRKESVH